MSFFRVSNPIWTIFNADGTLASNGTLTTFRSENKTELKATYLDPAGLIPAPNPIQLNEIGQVPFEIYWNSDELYYIELRDENETLIKSIDNFPFAEGGGGSSVVGLNPKNNLINGQFRFFFQDLYDTFDTGELEIANFWYFKKSNATATDSISFIPFNLGDTIPASPIYKLQYRCTAQGTGESFKDIYQKMADVRTFEQSQQTFSIQIYSDAPRTVEVFFRQYFGTGGSPSATVDTPISSMSLTGGVWELKSGLITVPSVGGKTLGTNGDDYVALLVRMPLDTTCTIEMTNCFLDSTDKVLPYPRLTKEQEDSEMLGAMVPEIGEDDSQKSIMVDPNSKRYMLDFAVPVGAVIGMFSDGPVNGFVASDGSTFNTYGSSSKARLFGVIGHRGGYGADGWVSQSNASGLLTILNTGLGAVTNINAGTSGFSATTPIAGTGSQHFNATIIPQVFYNAMNVASVYNLANGSAPAATAETSGFLFINLRSGDSAHALKQFLGTVAASAMTAGSHFKIYSTSIVKYVVWYKINGAGAAPSAPGYTPIEIDLLSTDNERDVLMFTVAKLNGNQVSRLSCLAASAMTGGSYFLINTIAEQFYVWFQISGVGSDPSIAGKTGLKVDLSSSDTAAVVASKISTTLNAAKFKVPNLMGKFMRFGPTNDDSDPGARLGLDAVGSIEFDQFYSHSHTVSGPKPLSQPVLSGGAGIQSGADFFITQDSVANAVLVADAGGAETRPINILFKPFMKY